MFEGKVLYFRRGYLECEQVPIHRTIYESVYGPIPKGYHIHHKDRNKLNNSIENLECLTCSQHMKIHGADNIEKKRELMKKAHLKSVEWLRSEEGKKFTSEKCKKEWEIAPYNLCKCEWCEKEFKTRSRTGKRKFCSHACAHKERRSRGLDKHERKCLVCSSVFLTEKWHTKKTCSKICANKLKGEATKKRYAKPIRPS